MMEYVVAVEEYYNQEFDFWLYKGEVIYDGDLEPDLIAELCATGVIKPKAPPKKSK
jgi:hypothetical protein